MGDDFLLGFARVLVVVSVSHGDGKRAGSTSTGSMVESASMSSPRSSGDWPYTALKGVRLARYLAAKLSSSSGGGDVLWGIAFLLLTGPFLYFLGVDVHS
jgi:hypothetical protein